VNKLESRLRSLPISDDGSVVFHVDYEHQDPSGRGRLFAIGDKVNVSNEKIHVQSLSRVCIAIYELL